MKIPSRIINLSDGLSIYIVCKIFSDQPRQGEKVILELTDKKGQTKITIGLTNDNNLVVWIIDQKGEKFKTKELTSQSFIDKSVLLLVTIEQIESKEFRISIQSYDNNNIIVDTSNLKIEGQKIFEYSIGANIQGSKNTKFLLNELIIRTKIDKGKDLEEIVDYLKNKHDLNHE